MRLWQGDAWVHDVRVFCGCDTAFVPAWYGDVRHLRYVHSEAFLVKHCAGFSPFAHDANNVQDDQTLL
jgi:hypothetical protein